MSGLRQDAAIMEGANGLPPARQRGPERIPASEDLLELRVPLDLRLAPDGESIAFCVKTVAPGRDGYRHALWLADVDRPAAARRLTMGLWNDTCPRWSPNGRSIAFLSDRGGVLRSSGRSDWPEQEGDIQVWWLDLTGGEATQVTRLPDSVRDIAWSPDGSALCVVSAATKPVLPKAASRSAESLTAPDYRMIDRLLYMRDDIGFTYDHPGHLWLIDLNDGEARLLTRGAFDDRSPAFSPDGSQIAFVSARDRDSDITWRTDVFVVAVDGGQPINVTRRRKGHGFYAPAWDPRGGGLAVKGFPLARLGMARDVWRFAPTGRDPGENLTAAGDLFLDALVADDLAPATDSRLNWSGDGRWVTFTAPVDGALELWRVEAATKRIERVTHGEHCLTLADQVSLDAGADRVAVRRSTPTRPFDVCYLDLDTAARMEPREAGLTPLASPMARQWSDLKLREPEERWHEVDGTRIQGWLIRGAGEDGPKPLVVECGIIHTWSARWEWQCLAARGISVYACNPRGTQGYGADFYAANFQDWGHGPMRDIMAGVEELIDDGIADPNRLGVTGGSHGGYLAAWLVAHSDRFAAAVACRPVTDWISEFLSGDIAGVHHPRGEYGVPVWEDPMLFWRDSPVAYASQIHTPLLIQHAENDLRCRIGQSEELFTVLRCLERPVRLYRVPEESHELTRSGTPFRRAYNLEVILDWFSHFLLDGETTLPPIRRGVGRR